MRSLFPRLGGLVSMETSQGRCEASQLTSLLQNHTCILASRLGRIHKAYSRCIYHLSHQEICHEPNQLREMKYRIFFVLHPSH